MDPHTKIFDGNNTGLENHIKISRWLSNPSPGNEVVITGVSGRFPKSENVQAFKDNLMNKRDMVASDNKRWDIVHPEIPDRGGVIPLIEKFDPGYFGISQREADIMDPLCRLVLERSVEAIFDAGVNPAELEGTNTGVFMTCTNTDCQSILFQDDLGPNNHALLGISRFMFPNRISYHLKLKGPSFIADTACSSSVYALEEAYKKIRDGTVDAAIVTAVTITLHPYTTLQFSRLGVLSPDGMSKTFDDSANGYVRAEAAAAIYMQRAKDSRRIYAQVVHTTLNCDGYKDQGITHPSQEVQKDLLDQFYSGCQVDPNSIYFVEAHGTGTSVGDAEEIQPIDDVFCKNREGPLLLGSVKSNMGHSENAAALCQIAKIIIAMESGLIPPNLHFHKPRAGVKALENGTIKIVTDVMPFKSTNGLVALSSFGFGGANGHSLLKWNESTKKNEGLPEDTLPRLVCISGRSLESLSTIMDYLKDNRIDAEFVALLHKIFRVDPPNHVYKGFSIVSKNGEISRSYVRSEQKPTPILIVFGDTSTTFRRMGKDLLHLPLFHEEVKSLGPTLQSLGIQLDDLFDTHNTTNDVLATTVIQIVITKILKALGVEITYSTGFACGEISNAYHTKELKLDQVLVEAHYVDKLLTSASKENHVNNHNGFHHEQKTADNKSDFQNEKNKEFTSFSLHSEIVKNAEILNGHSTKVSTKNHINGNSSLERFFNKIINPRINIEELQHLQHDYVVLEIGSTNLAEKQYLNGNESVIRFPNRKSENGIISLLTVIGRLYEFGHNLDLEKLYPPVQFPVSRGTPMISPIIQWDHKRDWFVMSYKNKDRQRTFDRFVGINIKASDWNFITGHVIDGRNLFPATGYLYLVWETLCMSNGEVLIDTNVIFEDIKFLRATTINPDVKLEFVISIQPSGGNFEVLESDTVIVSGKVRLSKCVAKEQAEFISTEVVKNGLITDSDIYKELRLRGYNYSGLFKGIKNYNMETSTGYTEWANNWVSFMDVMLQVNILQVNTRNLLVPTHIKRITIDASKHLQFAAKYLTKVPIVFCQQTNIIKSGFIEIRGLNASAIAKRKPLGEPILESYKFVANEAALTTEESIRINTQIILENQYKIQAKVVEIFNKQEGKLGPFGPLIFDAFSEMPLIQPNITVITDLALDLQNVTVEKKPLMSYKDAFVLVGRNLLEEQDLLHSAMKVLAEKGFLLSIQDPSFNHTNFEHDRLEILTVHTTSTEKFVLLSERTESKNQIFVDFSQSSEKYEWLGNLQKAANDDKDVVLYSHEDPVNGILGFVNCLRKEPGGDTTRCVFIQDKDQKFNPKMELFEQQLKKNLAVNVYKEGKWGTYRHFKMDDKYLVDSQHSYINVTTRGDLSSLSWIEGPIYLNSSRQENTATVHISYAPLNFKDVMIATGRLQSNLINMIEEDNCPLGIEYSGRTSEGKRVMGLCSGGAQANILSTDPYFMLPVPDQWTLEDAATVPVVYTTVLCAFQRGGVRKGQSILIHAGTGGVGQAAINVALHIGLEIFTTVGTEKKRDFIKKEFPSIKDSHIGNSRDTSFETQIKKATKGKGVDVVLNSLSEEKLFTSLRCLADGGQFLEIGKFDLANDNSLRLELLKRNIAYHGVFLDAYFNAQPQQKMSVVGLLFEVKEVEQAYRFMAGGKHIGKVLVKIDADENEEAERNPKPSVKPIKSLPRYYCDSQKSYIITGGLGGFGLELADWLFKRGARILILTSRNGIKTGYQASRIRMWRSAGCNVKISTANIKTKKGCRGLLKEAKDVAPVAAIFNLAVVLLDALLENQTEENFVNSLAPKAVAAHHLDELSRIMCPELRDFVVFSSVTCGRGTAGQTNYGMANSIMERICEKRKNDGFPALAIQWGAVGDVGLVAEMQKDDIEIEIGGTLQQKISSCMQVMDIFMRQNDAIVSSMVVAEKRSAAGAADNVVDAVAHIIGVRDIKTVSLHTTLPELGMDSMMATEIKQTLERDFGVFLTPQDVRTLTFARLHEIMQDNVTAKLDAAEATATTTENTKHVQELIKTFAEEEKNSEVIVRLGTNNSGIESPVAFFLPGIEGNSKAFEFLTSTTNANAWCFQYHTSNDTSTIQQHVQEILPIVKEKLTQAKEFRIVAHSYGCLLALELASILEKEEYLGKIILMDGSPTTTVKLLQTRLNAHNGKDLEMNVIEEMLSYIMPFEEISKLLSQLTKCNTFDERIETLLTLLPNTTQYSNRALKKIILDIQKRVSIVNTYEPTVGKLRSQVELFKPTEIGVKGEKEDYGLSEFVQDEVTVRYFDGNHFTILKNSDLRTALDEFLL